MPPNEGLRALFRREGASLVKKHSRRILAFVIVVVLVFQLETLQQVTNMFENQYENINTTAVIDNEGLATTEPTLTNASMNSTVTNETTLKGVLYARSVSWDFDKWFFPNGLPRHTIVLDHNRPDNYFQLALENQFENVTRGMEPFQMMKEYIRDNGRQRLQDEWDLCVKKTDPHPNGTLARIHSSNRWGCKMLAQRTFVVGRYSCPYEAGNRLYKYMNSLLWAMVTGRTFLSGYWDWKACQDEIEEVPENYCRVAVTAQEDCDAILRLNEWVPQWDDWKDILELEDPVRVDGINPKGPDALGRPYDQDKSPRVIRTGQQVLLTPGMFLEFPNTRVALLEKRSNRIYARRLLSRGYYFLYGMFLESLFTFQSQIHPDPSLLADPDVYQTWIIHSRHPTKQADGTYIQPETLCMEKNAWNITPPCVMYLMTDRPSTLKLLRQELLRYNCVAIVANHSRGTSFSKDHGVFAGMGYFQDLALARHARHGFVAASRRQRFGKGLRTSSGLPRGLLEFRRQLQGYQPPLHSCTQPFFQRDMSDMVQLPAAPKKNNS